jgi:hypothetical protein
MTANLPVGLNDDVIRVTYRSLLHVPPALEKLGRDDDAR